MRLNRAAYWKTCIVLLLHSHNHYSLTRELVGYSCLRPINRFGFPWQVLHLELRSSSTIETDLHKVASSRDS